ncbi:MAG: hypothetical protein QMC79_09205 [Anaerosomatales bacterium]|nr:hypothetical protein [Anaerosomatales bacterium]
MSPKHDERTPESVDAARLVALLDRYDVRQVLRSATAVTVSRAERDELPVPSGLSREETEALITAVKRTQAIYSPIPDREGRLHWYLCTGGMRRALTEVDRYCTADSHLYDATTSRAGTRFLVQSNVEETVATAQLERIDLDADAAKELLLMRRQPRSPHERLLVNQFLLTDELAQMVDRPFSPETLLYLHGRLTRGLPSRMAHTGNVTEEQKAVLRGLCTYAEHPTRAACEHAAITAVVLRAVVTYFELFPNWNGMMSRIILRFYALKQGYPVLGYLPVSQSELRMNHERATAGLEPLEGSAYHDRYHEAESTRWFEAQLALIVHSLEQLRARMARAEAIDAAVQRELHADSSLNHRQRSIIGRALRLPSATFRIGYHRSAHGIGYATAHRDFASLVEQGYLVEFMQGRMKVFAAGPRLEQRIGALADVGRLEDYEIPLPEELLRD